MSGDISMFEHLERIPSDFYVKQVKGKVVVREWGTVKLSTDGEGGVKGDLELREVMFVPGMRVNIFSLHRIRNLGSCSCTFSRKPEPGKVIPIVNSGGKQIATMEENSRARPTLICERYGGKEEGCMEGEVLGAKGIQMESLHKRLGHTSQSGMERLVREQMMRGLEEGMKGDFGLCHGEVE